MFEYRNTKTGATFSSPCVVSGGDWVEVGESEVETTEVLSAEPLEAIGNPPIDVAEIVDGNEEDTAGFDGITLKQIKQELDAFGVEYDKRANKQTLYDLMLAQGK